MQSTLIVSLIKKSVYKTIIHLCFDKKLYMLVVLNNHLKSFLTCTIIWKIRQTILFFNNSWQNVYFNSTSLIKIKKDIFFWEFFILKNFMEISTAHFSNTFYLTLAGLLIKVKHSPYCSLKSPLPVNDSRIKIGSALSEISSNKHTDRQKFQKRMFGFW